MVFVPLVVETLGGWEEQGEKQIKRIGAALARQAGQEEVKKLASAQARQTGEDQSEVTRHIYQRLSVILARGNAALLLNRFPTFASSESAQSKM